MAHMQSLSAIVLMLLLSPSSTFNSYTEYTLTLDYLVLACKCCSDKHSKKMNLSGTRIVQQYSWLRHLKFLLLIPVFIAVGYSSFNHIFIYSIQDDNAHLYTILTCMLFECLY